MQSSRQSRRRRARSQRNNPVVQQERQVVSALRDLTTVTQNYSLPRRRDILPPSIPHRGTVHRFVRSAFYNTVTANTGITFGNGNFKLSDLPNYTDFTALFDKFRFVAVICKFIPASTLAAVGSASVLTGDNPLVYTVIDYDDASVPTSLDELRQFDTAQCNTVGTFFTRVFCPRAALAAYGGTFTNYAQASIWQWHDCNSPSTQFYGLKWGTTAWSTTTGTVALWQIEVDYVIEFKNPR